MPTLKSLHPYTLARKGVFSLGSILGDDRALQWAKGDDSIGGARDAAISKNIIVYGSSLSALHAVETLLRHGVDPALILWVYRHKPDCGADEVRGVYCPCVGVYSPLLLLCCVMCRWTTPWRPR